jgi:hypothetical protein
LGRSRSGGRAAAIAVIIGTQPFLHPEDAVAWPADRSNRRDHRDTTVSRLA